jgi:hypothetical protein
MHARALRDRRDRRAAVTSPTRRSTAVVLLGWMLWCGSDRIDRIAQPRAGLKALQSTTGYWRHGCSTEGMGAAWVQYLRTDSSPSSTLSTSTPATPSESDWPLYAADLWTHTVDDTVVAFRSTLPRTQPSHSNGYYSLFVRMCMLDGINAFSRAVCYRHLPSTNSAALADCLKTSPAACTAAHRIFASQSCRSDKTDTR